LLLIIILKILTFYKVV